MSKKISHRVATRGRVLISSQRAAQQPEVLPTTFNQGFVSFVGGGRSARARSGYRKSTSFMWGLNLKPSAVRSAFLAWILPLSPIRGTVGLSGAPSILEAILASSAPTSKRSPTWTSPGAEGRCVDSGERPGGLLRASLRLTVCQGATGRGLERRAHRPRARRATPHRGRGLRAPQGRGRRDRTSLRGPRQPPSGCSTPGVLAVIATR